MTQKLCASLYLRSTVKAVLLSLRSQGRTHFWVLGFCDLKTSKSATLEVVFAKMAMLSAVIAETAMETKTTQHYNRNVELSHCVVKGKVRG